MTAMISLLLGFDLPSLGTWWNLGLGLGTLLAGATGSFIFKKMKTWAAKKKAKLLSAECTHDEKSLHLLNGGQKNSEINGVLYELREVLDAQRTVVGQYHNGGNFLDGNSIKRFSISHESVASGVSYNAWEMQNILVSLFWEIVPLLQENDAKGRIVSELLDSPTKARLVEKGVYSFSILPIRRWCKKNRKLQITGYVYAAWSDKESYDGKPESYIGTQLRNARSVIENQLLNGSG